MARILLVVAAAGGLTVGWMAAGGAWAQAPAEPPVAEPAPGPLPGLEPQQPAEAQIDEEAQTELDKIGQAYRGLESLELAGEVSAEFDVAGQQMDHHAEFTSTFQAPNKFRHEMKDDIIVGSTGEKTYLYQPSENMYLTADAPEERVDAQELPRPIPDVLQMQNPSLLLALSRDAGHQLSEGVSRVEKLADEQIEGKPFTALQFTAPAGDLNLLVDPETHLIRRVTINLARVLEQRGQEGVNKAQLTFNYTRTAPDVQVDEGQFEWSPPEGAQDVSEALGRGPEQQQPDAQGLVGQAAPEFELPNLQDQTVSLTEHRGNVVVLDFWATWCGPCVAAMPHLDKIYQDNAERGLKLYAVNLREDKQLIEPFMERHNLSMPVLLDRQGQVAEKYLVQGIPQTVVIGKDGQVRRVFVGFGPDTGEQIRQEVELALAAD